MIGTSSLLARRKSSSCHWNHFIRLDICKAKCRYCHRIIKMSKGSTGNLNRHLRLKHPAFAIKSADPLQVDEYVPESPENVGGDVEVRIHDDNNEKSGSEDQSNSENFIIHPSTSFPQSSPLSQPMEKRQRMTFEVVRKRTPQNKEEDEFSTMSRHISNKLRKLPPDVLPVVEKLITDVIFEAQCGNVSQNSRIAFYDMMNANLRNHHQLTSANKPDVDVSLKPDNQGSVPSNIVLVLPQSDAQKPLPLNLQVVQGIKPEVQNKPSDQFLQPNDQQTKLKNDN